MNDTPSGNTAVGVFQPAFPFWSIAAPGSRAESLAGSGSCGLGARNSFSR